MKNKLNIGAGSDIRADYVNHDIASLANIDVVHDLNNFPWPWSDNQFSEILAKDVIEHLDNFIEVMNELHRLTKVGGIVDIQVPYWNGWAAVADPTHKKGFHEFTFRFFDPDSEFCKERPYYSSARFKIITEEFILIPFSPYFAIPYISRRITIRNSFLKRFFAFLSNHFGNIIIDIHIKLKKI